MREIMWRCCCGMAEIAPILPCSTHRTGDLLMLSRVALRSSWRGILAAVGLLGLTLQPVTTATATTNPYSGLVAGFDISYPQCSGSSYVGPLPSGTFAILGVTRGRAFSQNECFGQEYQAATKAGLQQI